MEREPPGADAHDAAAGPKHDRMAALALPLPLALVDVVATTAVVVEGGACTTDCTGGLLLLAVAPTLRPLTVIGFGEDGSPPGAALVVLALVAVLALTVVWWAYAGRALTDVGRSTLTSFSRPRWWGLYAALFVGLFMLQVVVLAIDRVNELLGLLVEVGLWALLLHAVARWR